MYLSNGKCYVIGITIYYDSHKVYKSIIAA